MRRAKQFFENSASRVESPPPMTEQVGSGAASLEEWLTTEEAAKYLRISVGSLRNKVSNGTIKPGGKIGRLNRFRLSDLRELLLRKS